MHLLPLCWDTKINQSFCLSNKKLIFYTHITIQYEVHSSSPKKWGIHWAKGEFSSRRNVWSRIQEDLIGIHQADKPKKCHLNRGNHLCKKHQENTVHLRATDSWDRSVAKLSSQITVSREGETWDDGIGMKFCRTVGTIFNQDLLSVVWR